VPRQVLAERLRPPGQAIFEPKIGLSVVESAGLRVGDRPMPFQLSYAHHRVLPVVYTI